MYTAREHSTGTMEEMCPCLPRILIEPNGFIFVHRPWWHVAIEV